MSPLTYSQIFDTADTETRIPLAADVEERLLQQTRDEFAIVAALRAEGRTGEASRTRQPAMNQIIWQYIPALRGMVASLRRSSTTMSIDEIRADALAGLADTVLDTVEAGPFVVRFRLRAFRARGESAVVGSAHVPGSVRTKYNSARREANGDRGKLFEYAAAQEISQSSVVDLENALGMAHDFDSLVDTRLDEPLGHDIDDRLDAQIALRTIAHDRIATRVITRAFGFDGWNPHSDEAVAEGFKSEALEALEAGDPDADRLPTPARRTVARLRGDALEEMHSALCGDGSYHRCDGAFHSAPIAN